LSNKNFRSLGVGTLGVVPLSVHTVPTQVVTLAFMVPNSVAVALAVRMGVLLPQNVHLAKQVVVWTFVAGIVLIGIMSWAMYIFRAFIFQIFINAEEEEEVLEGCERIWFKVCFQFFQFSIFALNVGIATGLGMQWRLGLVTLVFLWLFGLPAAWYYGIIRYASIDVVWSWLIPPYVFINIILLMAFVKNDWNKISKEIRVREGMDGYETLISSPERRQSRSLYGAVDKVHSAL
jgi:Na+-driven multidrug efflux pump